MISRGAMKNAVHKPSVMHVIDSLSVGGAERMLVDIANAIDEREFAVSVCITRSGQALAHELRARIPVRCLERKSRFDPNGFAGLRRFSEEQQVDIFHAHGRSTYSFLLAVNKLGFISQPIILHDHFGDIETDQSVPGWFRSLGVQDIGYYLGVCSKLADWALKAGVPKEKIAVVDNALDFQRIDSIAPIDLHLQLDIPKEQKTCVMVGNLRPAKGLDLLVDACAALPWEKLPVFVIVGKAADPTYTQACQKRIEEAGLASHFRFAGPQDSSIPWVKGADFGVMPSRTESGPLVLIEMMACGLPFAAFNVGGISRKVSQYLPASFARPGDAVDLAQIMMRLFEAQPVALQASSAQTQQLALRLFNIQERISEITAIYHSVLQSTR